MKVRFCFMLLLLTATLVFASATAVADDSKEARKHFEQGVSLFQDAKYEKAVVAFRKAYDLHPTWKLFFNIGQCEASLKRHGLSLEAFERYLSEGGDEIPENRQSIVISEVQRLRVMVGVVEVKGKPGDEITLNNVVRGVLPSSERMKVAMGKMTLSVSREGEEILKRELTMSGGETITISVDKAEEDAKEEPPLPSVQEPKTIEPESAVLEDEETSSNNARTWAWVSWGVGGAALITSGILGGVVLSRYGKLEDDCPDDVCDPDRLSESDTIDNLSLVGDISLGVGAALVATGAILYWVVGSKKEKETKETSDVSFSGGPTPKGDGAIFNLKWQL